MRQIPGLREFIGRAFDVAFYSSEYPDLSIEPPAMLDHFCECGWIEGRNPNPYFDTVSYLLTHRDVALEGMNPLFHYLRHGRLEGRKIVSSVSPSARSLLYFGYVVPDWVGALRDTVDAAYYRDTFLKAVPKTVDPVAYFALRGWREGHSPNPKVLITDLTTLYPDAATLLVNPCLVALEVAAERYNIETEVSPPNVQADIATAQSEFIAADTGGLEPDIKVVAAEFDADFYLTMHADVRQAKVDPLDHYFYTGWKEGRNPRADFDNNFYLLSNEDVREANVNPFWHFIAIGRAQGRLGQPEKLVVEATPDQSDQLSRIAKEFSPSYYLSQYADIVSTGVDPLEHYFYEGWKEGRNPNKHFDTSYYLQANPDIKDANLNPFWHYLVAGRAEGRAAVRPGGYRRRILDNAKDPVSRSSDYEVAKGNRLSAASLRRRISAVVSTSDGIALALSHDCYIRSIGGTQIFISDEENKLRSSGIAYLQLSPRRPQLAIAEDVADFEVQIVLNGEFLGIARLAFLTQVIESTIELRDKARAFIVHSLLGFDIKKVLTLKKFFAPQREFFWLHDYTSLCEGFNLLRNDLEFCGSPRSGSISCRVCVYGAERDRHLRRMRQFFESGNFEVIAPSEFVINLWTANSSLPAYKTIVHPHWHLEPKPDLERVAGSDKISVAFIGYPSASKGWESFVRLVEEFSADRRYKFFHFGARNLKTLPECEFVVTEVTPQNRMAAKKLLEEYRIDYLAMFSPWPETFSYVAHEGVAAGCQILCFENSGNVAALVSRLSCGVSFKDDLALSKFFKGKAASKLARTKRAGRQRYEVINCGTSASLFLPSAEEKPQTKILELQVVS